MSFEGGAWSSGFRVQGVERKRRGKRNRKRRGKDRVFVFSV